MHSILNRPILLTVINKFVKDHLLCCPRSCRCQRNLDRNIDTIHRNEIIKLINNLDHKICLFAPDGTRNVRIISPFIKPNTVI